MKTEQNTCPGSCADGRRCEQPCGHPTFMVHDAGQGGVIMGADAVGDEVQRWGVDLTQSRAPLGALEPSTTLDVDWANSLKELDLSGAGRALKHYTEQASLAENLTRLKVKRLHPDARMPVYATAGAACFDLCAHLVDDKVGQYQEMIAPGHTLDLPTGLAFEVPEGHVLLIFSRSGHGFNHGLRLANCVGVIDSDYRGEVRVKLTSDLPSNIYNAPARVVEIDHGDRIAQAMLLPIPTVRLVEVDELSDTERGQKGFGSTGS